MLCNFCGTENREGNRFCGICGVRLERRKADRRVHNDSSYLRCEPCGYMNESGYKFCGMCGTRLDRRIADRRGTGTSGLAVNSSGGSIAVAPPMADDARMSQSDLRSTDRQRIGDVPRRSDAPVSVFRNAVAGNGHPDAAEKSGIVGPSFLGLSDEPDDDTTYLMEDENSSGGGLRKLVLLVILAVIAGLVFVQYRSSLHSKPKSPAPVQTSPTLPQSQNQPATAPPDLQNQAQPGTAGASQPSPQTAAPTNPDPAATDSTPGSQPPQDASSPPKSESALLPQMSATDVAEKSDDPSAATDTAENKKASDAAQKAFDAPVPVEQKPSPLLVRAQQFLHGQGVQQNCEQGMIYLRAAAQKNEPAAAVQMGALYASGRCVHQDRVMAYRWFNSAHELEPANQWIQRNMDLLWGQMTDQERRLAAY